MKNKIWQAITTLCSVTNKPVAVKDIVAESGIAVIYVLRAVNSFVEDGRVSFVKGRIDLCVESKTKTTVAKVVGDDICHNYHGGNAESVKANPNQQKKHLDRAKILNHISLHGPKTCDEIEIDLGMSHQTASARCSELKRDEILEKIGTRPTRSGRSAAVLSIVSE